MTAPGTTFAGPVISGPNSTPEMQGLCVLTKSVTLTHNGTNAVSGTMQVPNHSKILDFLIDNTTAWNSATSDVLSIGIAAAGTEYVDSVDTKTAGGRLAPTYSAAQLTAMLDVGTNTNVVATVTPTGSASAGSTTVTMRYVQTQNWDTN